MTTIRFRKLLVSGFSALQLATAFAQVSSLGSFPSSLVPPDYVGWNGSTTIPLEVRHNGNQPIQWWTDSIQRMRLSPSVTGNMGPLNQYTNVNRTGYLLLSGQPDAFTNPGCRAPFTRMHLIDSVGTTSHVVYAQQHGYRPWQRNGITFTGNSDQGYVGAKYAGNDTSDMVLQWSDNPEDAIYGTDRLRFLFTNRMDNATYGARSEEGLESFRVHVPNDTSANVGIGDFYRAGIINGGLEDPTERLHVNDGTVRIDSLIPDYNNDTLSRVVMTDGTGRLHWRNISTWPQNPNPPAGCDWEPNAGQNKMYTAWRGVNSNGSCPEVDWTVGIGTNNPVYKLDVVHDETLGSVTGGSRIDFRANATGTAEGFVSKVSPISTNTAIGADVRGIFADVNNAGQPGSGATADGVAVLGRITNGASGISADILTGTHGDVSVTNGNVSTVYGAQGTARIGGGTVATAYGMNATASPSGSGVITNGYGIKATTSSASTTCYGIMTNAANAGANNYGAHVTGSGTSTNNYGTYSAASGATVTNYGVYATGGSGTTNYGVRANASGGSGSTNYGVWSTASGFGATNWAVWSQGNQFSSTGAAWQTSDENLKTDIEDLNGAMERLMQLRPKTYRFRTDEYPSLQLAQEPQFGLLAQNMEEVLPNLVKDVHRPADVDSTGAETAPAMDFKAVKYDGLIPLLIAAVQEQQGHIAAMEQRTAELESMLAACCNNPDRGALQQTGNNNDALSIDPTADRKLRIVPNPFSEPPTVYYTLDRAGRMQLIANSADGKQLNVLHEASLQAGDYQYAWDTSALAPGMYYVTLLLDGQPMVKKAVKVTR